MRCIPTSLHAWTCDVVVISSEVGVAKPGPEIFALACERLRVAPEEAMHIGDTLDVDALVA